MSRRRRPFAKAEKWRAGWYAVGQGVCSGPFQYEDQAAHVVHLWNQATELKGECK